MPVLCWATLPVTAIFVAGKLDQTHSLAGTWSQKSRPAPVADFTLNSPE
jgi:hypothetical protein